MYVTTKFSVRPCENGHLLIFLRKSQKWWILSFSCLVFGFYFCASLIPLVVFFSRQFSSTKNQMETFILQCKINTSKKSHLSYFYSVVQFLDSIFSSWSFYKCIRRWQQCRRSGFSTQMLANPHLHFDAMETIRNALLIIYR